MLPHLSIVRHGDPVLTARAPEVASFDRELRWLLSDMADAMAHARGVGLAAPQVGVPLRALIWAVDGEVGHMVNPVVERRSGTTWSQEGCLSIPGAWGEVERAAEVVVHGLSMFGEPVTVSAAGLLARVLQHEVDHLDGLFFVDRMSERDRAEALGGLPLRAATRA